VSADQVRVWIARFAAPLAFFVAATVLVILVQRALDSDAGEARSDGSKTEQVNTEPTTTNPDGTANLPRGCRKARYTVKRGDTLESIAAKCDVSLAELLELNPQIDPLALNPGDRVRIRPPGQQQEAT
jgi:LysM repeat protein